MNQMRLKALAKINLGLDVLRRKEDGYHEVKMIMQTINLHDQIHMKKIEEDEIKIRTNLYYLPNNENNLAYRAAKMLKDEFNLPGGVFINLKKVIPVAAGMAGGSSDAAAVLFGMNKMYGLKLSMQELMDRGVKLGTVKSRIFFTRQRLQKELAKSLQNFLQCQNVTSSLRSRRLMYLQNLCMKIFMPMI